MLVNGACVMLFKAKVAMRSTAVVICVLTAWPVVVHTLLCRSTHSIVMFVVRIRDFYGFLLGPVLTFLSMSVLNSTCTLATKHKSSENLHYFLSMGPWP